MNREVKITGISVALAKELRSKGIRFCHWKSNSHLNEGLAGKTDLDVLADKRQQDQLEEVLIALKFIRIKSRIWNRYPSVEDWIGFDDDSGVLIHLHLHYAMATGLKYVKHIYLPWSDFVLENTIEDHASGWLIPNPAIELVVLLARIWAKMPAYERMKSSPHVPRHVLDELSWLIDRTNISDVLLTASALRINVPADNFERLFSANIAKADVLPISKKIYETQKECYRVGWWTALVQAQALRLCQYTSLFILKYVAPVPYRKSIVGGGAVFAFIGSDGSGKSTLSAAINGWLRFKIDSHGMYLGSGDGEAGFVNRIRGIFISTYKKRSSGESIPKKEGERRQQASLLKKMYRLFYLHLVMRKLLLVVWARRAKGWGGVIIMDRFPQQKFPGINDGPIQQDGQGFFWAAALERLIYKQIYSRTPDFLIRMNVSPGVAHGRKPDHDIVFLEKKSELVRKIELPDCKSYDIDADQDYSEVLKQIKRIVWAELIEGQSRSEKNH